MIPQRGGIGGGCEVQARCRRCGGVYGHGERARRAADVACHIGSRGGEMINAVGQGAERDFAGAGQSITGGNALIE